MRERETLDPRVELFKFAHMLDREERFVFVRFSDGEMEILRGHRLELSGNGVLWSRGKSRFQYPQYDHKSFDPDTDSDLRESLLASAKYRSGNYYKGIPTRHNRDHAATKLMRDYNGGSLENLTFNDLWVNSNYPLFLQQMLPRLQPRQVTLISNFRAQPKLINPAWTLFEIPDGAFQQLDQIVPKVMEALRLLPARSTVLSSASSLSNILGHLLSEENLDLTFIDIGTALHPFLGMEDPRRLYLSQLKPWTLGTARAKLGYLLSRGKLKW